MALSPKAPGGPIPLGTLSSMPVQPFITSIEPRGMLSFGPDAPPIPLTSLNVIIGPNGSGKSNLIEIFELLRATPGDLAAAIRQGGGIGEWLWKGDGEGASASLEAVLELSGLSPLRYRLQFGSSGQRMEVLDEALENAKSSRPGKDDPYFYYRFQQGRPVINTRQGRNGKPSELKLSHDSLDTTQSVLSQRKDPDLYPELTEVGRVFGRILTFREWSFGRDALLRAPQPADLPSDVLLPNMSNLGLVINDIEHSGAWNRLNECVRRFLPRFKHLSTRVQANSVQIFLHEDGLRTPVPATRLSDGTIRFIALLAILLKPDAAPLICLEEPELGFHPDALALLAELLVDASKRTQLVVTTHSDILVSALSEHADSVLVSEHSGGSSQFRRLESEKLRFWLDKYRLGEIWRMGELGGNP